MHLLEQGTGSFKRAKHIKVRYFWLKDLIDEKEIVLLYIPSEELVADMLTKATTGAKFKLSTFVASYFITSTVLSKLLSFPSDFILTMLPCVSFENVARTFTISIDRRKETSSEK